MEANLIVQLINKNLKFFMIFQSLEREDLNLY